MAQARSRRRAGAGAQLFLLVLLALAAAPALAQASGPTAIAQDAQGVSYVGFATGGQIARFDAAGNALAAWGSPGGGTGQLGGVVAISVAPTGNVWVLDTNNRVQQFTPSGTYVSGVTLSGCGGGGSPDPLTRGGLDVTSSQIFVAHPCADQVIRMNLDFSSQATLSLQAHPKGVAVGAPQNGHPALLYVAEPAAGKVETFDAQTFALVHSQSIAGTPSDVFADIYGQLVVADSTSDTISFYDTNNSYSAYRTLGRPGSSAGSLNQPLAFDVHGQDGSGLAGNLFIADYGNSRIQRWDAYGTTIWTAGASASSGGPAVPTNTAPPSIQGTPSQGGTVTCTTGAWTGAPTAYAYSWDRDASPIAGATSSSYTVAAADVGRQLTCVVLASNAAGPSQPAASAPVVPSASGQAPANTAAPSITGQASPGHQLTCNPGAWTGTQPISYSYTFQREGSQIAAAQTYTVVAADVSHALTCTATASNAYGTTSATSLPVTPTAGTCSGTVGVTINDAAIYTNNPAVTLTINAPNSSSSVIVSNDGGFASAQTFAIAGDCHYAWTLTTSGQDRLPKTVYVRFRGSGVDPNQTFTDDIVLDQTPPRISSATISRTSSAAHAAGLRGGHGRYTLRVRASDDNSGVAALQLASSPRARRPLTLPYHARTTLTSLAAARWVRAIDHAGNYGHWRAVKRR